MSLIDRTYFIGELNIPNNSTPAIGGLLDWFIEKYEQQLLTDILGYELYKALKAGLLVDPVAQKWTDLIEGVEYTNTRNRVAKWKGLVTQPPTVLNALDALNTITVVVGRGQLYDPIANGSTTTIPAALIGKDFVIEQRAFGPLRSDEISIVGNVLTLLGGKVFGNGDTYFYKSATLAINTTTGTSKESLIAQCVYYWFMRNNHTQTAGMGETKAANENAAMASPALKMKLAWNRMAEWICELMEYLEAAESTYTEWKKEDAWCVLNKFRPINEFNI